MRSAPEILNVIEAARICSAESFFIYKPTWDLVINSLNWSIGKRPEEIIVRLGICRYKQGHAKLKLMKNSWQLIIETLRWVLEETDIDPLESRRNLIPLAK